MSSLLLLLLMLQGTRGGGGEAVRVLKSACRPGRSGCLVPLVVMPALATVLYMLAPLSDGWGH